MTGDEHMEIFWLVALLQASNLHVYGGVVIGRIEKDVDCAMYVADDLSQPS